MVPASSKEGQASVGTGAMQDSRLSRLKAHLADRYAFLSVLGEGASGTVFEVSNLALRRPEALKALAQTGGDPLGAERFKVEARIAAGLDHPHIVKVHASGQAGETLWYTMELVDGPTLSEVLEAGGALDSSALSAVALPVLDALAYSHGRGVIHRDLKPANILFDLQGRPRLADFGIAKALENPMDTRTGQVLGTPAYLAPEQAMGEPVDARADLYALGVLLYRAAAGRLPFLTDNVLQTLLQRLREEPPHLRELCPVLPPALADVIMRALAREREDRWPGAEAMREAWAAVCREGGIPWEGGLPAARNAPRRRDPLPEEPAPPRAETGAAQVEATADLPPRPRRRMWFAAGLGAASLLAAAFAFLPPRPGPRAPAPVPPIAQDAPEPPRSEPAQAPPARRPEPAPAREPEPRLPVVYAQLVGDPVAPAPVEGCAGISVSVALTVGEDGLVKECRVLSQVPPACARAARDVARRFRFRPALDAQGRPVPSTVAAAVEFPEKP